MSTGEATGPHFPAFDRKFFDAAEDFTVIGQGSIGGKALGLAFIRQILAGEPQAIAFPGLAISIPRLTVMATDVFDAFMAENDLYGIALSGEPDEAIAMAFQRGSLPASIVGDVRALIQKVRQPLAVRSSSLLEDAMHRPFAGIYGTKMIPNNQPDAESRFRKLVEAIKFVYASTFFQDARSYIPSAGKTSSDEKMAVVIQEVVGSRHGERFYPAVSGVGRSFNFYPTGPGKAEEGVVNLALGLGKTIVDGGLTWAYSPAHPIARPPYGSLRDLLYQTQTEFWAVNMGKPPAYDPIRETEYLVRSDLAAAEMDGTLRYTASTYDPASDRLVPGIGRPGPRVLTFSGLLELDAFPVNPALRQLLTISEAAVGAPVEIEFAITLPTGPAAADGVAGEPKARLGFLQVRPLVVSAERVDLSPEELTGEGVLVASESVLGNGVVEDVKDVVYVRPDRFDMALTPAISSEIETLNQWLVDEGRPYLLIGFGRWGSSDPWLGIPVKWRQLSGARAIVEASLPSADVQPSQGSHFFHNLTSFKVVYFTVRHTERFGIDWGWLDARPAVSETEHVRHIRLDRPLVIRVDGRSGRGLIAR